MDVSTLRGDARIASRYGSELVDLEVDLEPDSGRDPLVEVARMRAAHAADSFHVALAAHTEFEAKSWAVS